MLQSPYGGTLHRAAPHHQNRGTRSLLAPHSAGRVRVGVGVPAVAGLSREGKPPALLTLMTLDQVRFPDSFWHAIRPGFHSQSFGEFPLTREPWACAAVSASSRSMER